MGYHFYNPHENKVFVARHAELFESSLRCTRYEWESHFSKNFVVVDFEPDPRVPLILGRSFLKTSRALIDVYEGEITLRVGREAITFNLDQTSRYTANYHHMTANRIDVIDMAYEEYSQEVLGFSNVISSGNPTPYYDPIVSTSSPTLTPFGDSDFLLFEEADSFLAIEDDPTSPEPLEVETQGTWPHVLEYAFLEGNDKLPVIIAKDLKNEEKAALIEVLKSHKRAIAWKLSDIKGIDPEFYTHKILMRGLRTVGSDQRRVESVHLTIEVEWATERPFSIALYGPMLEDSRDQSYCFLDGLLGLFLRFNVPNLRGFFLYMPIPFGQNVKTCEGHHLVLNWEKSHFMVKEDIVLGYKISKSGIEVDRAKVDVIAKLPHPTTMKEFDVVIRDKKGAENLAADHLSRLENPNQDKLENKEITDYISLESLGSVAYFVWISTSMVCDFANYHCGKFLCQAIWSS
ncbi:hypothetical protein Tco_0324238 [Tanacetum coccineum]